MTAPVPFTSYQKKLFAFLGVACFFEGYDFFALSQLLPNIGASFGLSSLERGAMITVVNIGTMLAYLLVRMGDRWGRKPLMTVTIIGYSLCTFATGLAPNVVVFALAQLAARVFLIGEWAISMVYAAEEFPAERRGTVIGVIQATTALGGVVCAGVVPLLLKNPFFNEPFKWRFVYLSAIVPLALIAYLRRDLRETGPFESRKKEGLIPKAPDMFRIWRSPSRGWVLKVSFLWFLTYIGSSTAVTYWKEFALNERGMTDAQVGKAITIAALVSMPLVFAAGKLLDVIGRRAGGAVIYAAGAIGIAGAYTLSSPASLTVALVFAIFGATAVLSVMNAITAELFPTEFRADAYAWSNNMIGRVGYVVAPVLVGWLALPEHVGGYGPVVALTPIGLVLAIVAVFAMVPETKGKELDDKDFSH
jgi:putative MFS transporter